MRSKFNGERLRRARIYRGMTLAELGELIDLSKQTLSLYENNRVVPDFSTVIKLTNALHFPANYFFQKDTIDISSGTTYFRLQLQTLLTFFVIV